MLQLFATIRKEFLILLRDRSGMAILFIMPVALVTIMALIQDAPFRDYQELKIPALLINNDRGSLGGKIEDGLKGSGIFEISDLSVTESQMKNLVAKGDYQIGVVIPENASQQLESKVKYFVDNTLSSMGLNDSAVLDSTAKNLSSQVNIYFAPGIKLSFKNSVMSSIRQVASKLESQTLLASFHKELNPGNGENENQEEEFGDFISFSELSTGDKKQLIKELNSVQHNVPAWTMFGMFFIVISLAGSIIKEREDGSYLRIRTMPGSYLTVLSGKVSAYLAVCLFQCLLMLMVGLFLLPMLGLPKLIIGDALSSVIIVAICSGLAATGYGVLVGTIFNTHQQASTFGSVSIVILAALGGIWVPVYVMPGFIQNLAELSPLYWGLSAFQQVFLGDGSLASVAGYVYKLLLFFAVTLLSALMLNKFKNN